MELKHFRTLIKGDHKLGDNKYIQGRIHGAMTLLCNHAKYMHGVGRLLDGSVCLVVDCTIEEYERFKTTIEDWYPDLCIFDYQVNKD